MLNNQRATVVIVIKKDTIRETVKTNQLLKDKK